MNLGGSVWTIDIFLNVNDFLFEQTSMGENGVKMRQTNLTSEKRDIMVVQSSRYLILF